MSSVEPPRVLCHASAGSGGEAGAASGGSDSAGGGAGGEASWDDDCKPPPSTCLDSYTLVYFTEGACVEGQCEWQPNALLCGDTCIAGGCNSSITTK